MKGIFFIITCLVYTVSSFAQTSIIRFVHIGVQTKPIGTVCITLQPNVQPLDSTLNSQLGTVIQTDTKTFAETKSFIEKFNSLCFTKQCAGFESGTFEVLVSDKFYAYINSNKSRLFFLNLIKDLQKRQYDDKVIDALQHLTL
jgi:hypothetical protein